MPVLNKYAAICSICGKWVDPLKGYITKIKTPKQMKLGNSTTFKVTHITKCK